MPLKHYSTLRKDAMKFQRLKVVISALLLLFISSIPTLFAQTPPLKKFIAIADIHFNPFIGCDKYPNVCPILSELRVADIQSWDAIFQKYTDSIQTHYHQDTDYLLLQSTLTELRTLFHQERPTFILMLGDFLAHKFPEQYKKYAGEESITGYQTFVKKTFQYLTYKLNQVASTTPIYPILGNNDSYNGNYKVDPQGSFLQDSADIFVTLIKNKNNQQQFLHEFPNSGYYAITLAKNRRLIVLNSVLFSAMHHTQAMQKAAMEQLSWLELQLSTANQQQQNVLLVLHIPPGVDAFLTTKMRFDIIRDLWHPLFWQATYNERFLALLQHYSTTIAGVLPAHIHNDAFQLIASKTLKTFIPVSFVPAISPIYGNNPGLKVFNYNPWTLQLVNFKTYFYPFSEKKSPRWQQEYDFNAVYQPRCKQCSLMSGMLRLTKDNRLVDSYEKYYAVGRNAQPITTQHAWVPYYWCSIYNADWESYKACLSLHS